MKPATWPRSDKSRERLMVLDRESGALSVRSFFELPSLLDEGDLIVVNDAATLPGVLRFRHHELEAELRLAAFDGGTTFRAIVFGAGDHRIPTEERGPAPVLASGEILEVGEGLSLEVVGVDPVHPRLVTVSFLGPEERVWSGIVASGRPVQYSYVDRPLSLYHVETVFASRPWAAEMPSAGRPLTFGLLRAFEARGIGLARLTHGAGLSSTGDPALDARLPLRERFDIPEVTADAVHAVRERGRRVVAVGTSVVRALEASARRGNGAVVAGEATTELRLGRDERPMVVDAVLTGMHEPGTSHFELLEGFADRPHLEAACALGTREGFLLHEFGDSLLVVGAARRRLPVAA